VKGVNGVVKGVTEPNHSDEKQKENERERDEIYIYQRLQISERGEE
jgi:hypothetical protein